MSKFIQWALRPSERKLLAFLLAFLALVLNDLLRLGLDHTEQTTLVGFVAVYIGQSTAKEIIQKKQEAKAAAEAAPAVEA
jgi:hypothetical protein